MSQSYSRSPREGIISSAMSETLPCQDRRALLPLRRPGSPAPAPHAGAQQGALPPIGGSCTCTSGENPAARARRDPRGGRDRRRPRPPPHRPHQRDRLQRPAHWLMFLYEVTKPVTITRMTFREGTLDRHAGSDSHSVRSLETDRLRSTRSCGNITTSSSTRTSIAAAPR